MALLRRMRLTDRLQLWSRCPPPSVCFPRIMIPSSSRLIFTSRRASAEEEGPSKSPEASSAAADAAAPPPTNPKQAAKEFPPIQLSQKSPVLLKRVGKMVNNRAIKDFKRRLCYAKYEAERLRYKAACNDRNLPLEVRRFFESKLNALPRDSSLTRIRNRCIITGRARSVYRKFRISRHCLRELANRGELAGVYKASW